MQNQGSAVGVATSMWWLCYAMGGPRFESRVQAYDFSLLQNVQSQPRIQWEPGFFPGVKAAGAWSSSLISVYCPHDVERDTFTFWIPRCKSTPCCEETCYAALIMSFFFLKRDQSLHFLGGLISVYTVSTPRTGRRTNCDSIPISGWRFFPTPNLTDQFWDHLIFYSLVPRVLSFGIRRPGQKLTTHPYQVPR